METNNIINIPEGFEIDREQSTKRQIVLKAIKPQRPKTWEEYCEKMRGTNSYYIEDSYYTSVSAQFGYMPIVTEFESKGDADAFAAYSKLLKMRRQWVGSWEPDWTEGNQIKFTIVSREDKIVYGATGIDSRPMSFPTKEMRDEFLDCFKDLLEQAKSLL